MPTDCLRCVATSPLTRRIRARRALSALLLVLLALSTGCHDGIRRTIRQGAFGVFEDAVNAFYADLGSAVVQQIDNLDADPGTYTGGKP
jgi:hypothetical protein